MKTPKREYYFYDSGINPDNGDVIMDAVMPKLYDARRKRKNRVSQLKRTIARLTDESRKFREFQLGGHLKIYSPEWEAFMVLSRLKTPAEGATLEEKLDHWLTLRKVTELALDAVCFAAKDYGVADEKEYATCHPKTAENGQQTALPPTGEKQAGNAEQTTERKGN